jgi:hypothetical protein
MGVGVCWPVFSTVARHGVYLCRRDAAHDTVAGALDDLDADGALVRLVADQEFAQQIGQGGRAEHDLDQSAAGPGDRPAARNFRGGGLARAGHMAPGPSGELADPARQEVWLSPACRKTA